MYNAVVTPSALHELLSYSTIEIKYPISALGSVIKSADDVREFSVYIDDFGKRFELLNCHNCTLIFSHELKSDALAVSKVRLIRNQPVLICKTDTVLAQSYCQRFLEDYDRE